MKRNADLIRKILMEIENFSHPIGMVPLNIEEYNDEEISYHLLLLEEAGFIEAYNFSGGDTLKLVPKRLTWTGHEFLDLARNEQHWGKAKDIMMRIGGFAFEVASKVLINLATSQALQLINNP
jgi:DNA-binding transcriptional ArsR family regulator